MATVTTLRREHIRCKQALGQHLDEALQQTLPASDPIALAVPYGQEKDELDYTESQSDGG